VLSNPKFNIVFNEPVAGSCSDPLHGFLFYFFNTHFNAILPYMSTTSLWTFFLQVSAPNSYTHFTSLQRMVHVLQIYPPSFDYSNNIRRSVSIIKFLIMKFSPSSYNFVLIASLVITAWHVLRFRIEETASRYGGVAANVKNKQSRTAHKGWFSGFGVVYGANSSLMQRMDCYGARTGTRRVRNSKENPRTLNCPSIASISHNKRNSITIYTGNIDSTSVISENLLKHIFRRITTRF
jgi:hypothetical protein